MIRVSGPELLTEALVAVPSDTADIYVRHQQVWSVVRPFMIGGRPDFLFRHDGGRIFRVRSSRLRGFGRRVHRLPDKGRLSVDVTPVKKWDGRYTPLAPASVPEWFATLAKANGLDVYDIVVEGLRDVRGAKTCKTSGRILAIRMPAARIVANYRIEDDHRAHRALEAGIGRARRFGFGMIDLVP